MARTLLETIHEKATASFTGDPTKDFGAWSKHWHETAEKWRQELLSEGLTETAKSVQEHIVFQRNPAAWWFSKTQATANGDNYVEV